MCRKLRRFGVPEGALMLLHILVAAWRNLLVNRLASVLAIIGLAVGITAALVSGLVVRSQLSFNHFIDGYDRTYLAVSLLAAPGAPDSYDTKTNFQASPLLQMNLPGIEASTRLLNEAGKLQRGDLVNEENIGWADPSLFKVLPVPVIRGDASATLRRPDGLVMTASLARKYFGRSDPLGESLIVNGHPMILGAVLADFSPGETDLQGGTFASGLAAHSPMTRLKPDGPQGFSVNVQTYVRLQSRAEAAGLARNVEAVTRRFLPPIFARMGISYSMPLVRIDQIHLWEPLAPGAQARLALAGVIGFLILLIAVANYINLVLASVPRRAREIALRKVNGAGRRHILLQFLGEALLCVLAAACLAFGASEPLLHFVNAFMSEGEAPNFWSHPAQLGLVLPGLLLAAIVTGAYPATVVSAIRPATILRKVRLAENTLLRNVLVAGQFSILIALLIGGSVVYLQNNYASRHDLNVAADRMLVIPGRCPNAFRQEAARLPGVEGVACSGVDYLEGRGFGPLRVHGQTIATRFVSAEFGIFGLYGLSPLAGSLGPFPLQDATAPATYIAINATAARRFGFASPAGAVGQVINLDTNGKSTPVRIVAVVPDFQFYTVSTVVQPTIFMNSQIAPHGTDIVSIRLRGQNMQATLAALEQLWPRTGNKGPSARYFLSDRQSDLYRQILHEAELYAVFAGVAIILACMGLVGIAASAVQRRVREIGIRKAFGARSGQIVKLLLWQFARPVLLANLVAWPVALWWTRRWLAGFAYHIELHWWLFAGASLVALAFALLTVGGQAWMAARTNPIHALRYE
jgi:putative ABC transport system permease protein